MKYSADSPEYTTIYLKWPVNLPKTCPICKAAIKKKYPDNGKIVHTLEGDINQVTYFYACTNTSCSFYDHPFNPRPRFEFGGFYYGKDVLQQVAEYGLGEGFKPKYIHSLLKKTYKLKISESTIRRMLAVCTVVKSHAIDKRTFEIIQKQGFILLGLDGEDPQAEGPALWAFVDLISNRVLLTVYLESAPATVLRGYINQIKEKYNVPIKGAVSDKQSNIVTCFRDFFPDIPHQYCTFHFTQNLWSHLELMDGRLHKAIRKVLNKSYFLKSSADTEILFEEHGKLKPVEVFKPIIKDLKKMKRYRNKKFEQLRGIWLYEQLKKYAKQMREQAALLPDTYRMYKIFTREAEKWEKILAETEILYGEICTLFQRFKRIYKILYTKEADPMEIQDELDDIFTSFEEELQENDPQYNRDDLKSFLAKSNSSYIEILGEWVRLWHSYRPGLFTYSGFSQPIKTIIALEQGFGQQKSRFYGRVSKKRIGNMILTEGDYHLRFVFCEDEEFESDIWEEATEFNWELLIETYGKRKNEISSQWLRRMDRFEGIEGVRGLFYENR